MHKNNREQSLDSLISFPVVLVVSLQSNSQSELSFFSLVDRFKTYQVFFLIFTHPKNDK